ncbi:TIGR04500 family putative peptide maturation system protein [Streptosporangiaceae bacterium NEAU-GS5]|nr:TIGR04500 family putative peptide maturation system protein [Streptosporangiaceae bacterium NEAU-GS5]
MTTMTTTTFESDLADAVRLLRELPRHRDRRDEARAMVAQWAAAHPGREAELVIDETPGTGRVSYDLLLAHPDGGTVGLTAHTEDGVPWIVDHSTHWAAGQVLSVDGVGLSMPAALYALRSLGTRDRQVHEQLIDYRILMSEIERDGEPVSREELQRAADAFRQRRGLHGRAETMAWLAEIGLPEQAFADHMENDAKIARIRARFPSDVAYKAWLAERRSTSHIRWHWL